MSTEPASDALEAALEALWGSLTEIDREAIRSALTASLLQGPLAPLRTLAHAPVRAAMIDGGPWIVARRDDGWRPVRLLDAKELAPHLSEPLGGLPFAGAWNEALAEAFAQAMGFEADVCVPSVSRVRRVVEDVHDALREVGRADASALLGEPAALGDELLFEDPEQSARLTELLVARAAGGLVLPKSGDEAAPIALEGHVAEALEAAMLALLPQQARPYGAAPIAFVPREATLAAAVVADGWALCATQIDHEQARALVERAILCEDALEPLEPLLPLSPALARALVRAIRSAHPVRVLDDIEAPGTTLRFHAETFALLGMQPAPPAVRLLDAAAQRAGGPLPASYAEWCALPGGDLILSRTTGLCDRFFVTRPRRVAMPDGRVLLQLMDENQGCFNNGVLLDGSDDPAVWTCAYKDSRTVSWFEHAASFSGYLRALAFDSWDLAFHEVHAALARPVLPARQLDLPFVAHTRVERDGQIFDVHRFGDRRQRVRIDGWRGAERLEVHVRAHSELDAKRLLASTMRQLGG